MSPTLALKKEREGIGIYNRKDLKMKTVSSKEKYSWTSRSRRIIIKRIVFYKAFMKMVIHFKLKKKEDAEKIL